MGKCYTLDSNGNNERGLIEFKNINSFTSPVSKSFYDNGVFGVREALKNHGGHHTLGLTLSTWSSFPLEMYKSIGTLPPFFNQIFVYQNDSEWPKMDFKHNFKKRDHFRILFFKASTNELLYTYTYTYHSPLLFFIASLNVKALKGKSKNR